MSATPTHTPKSPAFADEAVHAVNLEYYLRQAPGREDYWRKMAAPRFRIATFLRLLRRTAPRAIADLGCGSGELLRELKAAFPSAALCGIDLSERQIDDNRRRDPGIAWREADLDDSQALPPDIAGCFDAVMAAEIIEHVARPQVFLRNALALARPGGGQLLLSTQSGRVGETERRVGHRRHFSAAELRELLEQSGWHPLRIWNAGWPFHDISKRLANFSPDRTMHAYSEERYGLLQNAVCWMLRLAFRVNSRHRGAQLFAIAEKR